MNRFRRRLTYANVVASLSLFFALAGGAYAAVAITSEDIVDETIQSQDIGSQAIKTDELGKQAVTLDRVHDYSVNSAKIVDNSLSSPDVANGSLTGWDIANHSLTGSDLDVDVKTVEATTRESDPDQPYLKTVMVACPAGYTAIGGGGSISPDHLPVGAYFLNKHLHLLASRPHGATGWTVEAALDADTAEDYTYVWTLTAYARCAAL